MEYAKLQLADTRSHTWRRASQAARGTATSVLTYCADQEDGGLIQGAKAWGDEDWMATCACRQADILAAVASGLLAWKGDSLVCPLYDERGHQALQIKKLQGPHGVKGAEHGKKGGRPPKGDNSKPPEGVLENPHEGDTSKPPHPPIPPTHTTHPPSVCVAGATPPPPADAVDTHPRDEISYILASRGLRTKPEALAEWMALLKGPLVGALPNPEALRAALTALLERCAADGVAVAFAPHAAGVAQRMADERRQREERRQKRTETPTTPALRETVEEARARRLRNELNPIERSVTDRWHVAENGDWVRGAKPVEAAV